MTTIFSIPISATITTAGGDHELFEASASATRGLRLRGFVLGQTSEVGDAAEEGLQIGVYGLAATVTSSNGSAATPRSLDGENITPGFTAKNPGTSIATTSGTTFIYMQLAWNIRNSPYEFWFPDTTFCPVCRPSESLVIRQLTTAADDYSFFGTVFIEEP